MKGIDVSHHQGVINWEKVSQIKEKDGSRRYQFAFIKATQGTGMIDPRYAENIRLARKFGFAVGAYHFAGDWNPKDKQSYPQSPIAEAEHFCQNVGKLNPGDIVILDYETKVLPDPGKWSQDFILRVNAILGFKPILYTYDSFLRKYDWKPVVRLNVGLWAARYGLGFAQEPVASQGAMKPTSGDFPFWAIWQYSSAGSVPGIVGRVDLNTTDLKIETLLRYGKPLDIPEPPKECSHSCQLHCNKV